MCDACISSAYLKSLHGSVVGVHHELREGGELGGPVPPIATVHQCVTSLQLHVASYHGGTLHRKKPSKLLIMEQIEGDMEIWEWA